MDGKRRTPVSPAVAAGEGRSILPAKESPIDRRVWHVHIEMRSERKRLVRCIAESRAGPSTRERGVNKRSNLLRIQQLCRGRDGRLSL
jgi:hypothetical protein